VPANLPPIWSAEQLEIDRLRARKLFREERMREPLEDLADTSLARRQLTSDRALALRIHQRHFLHRSEWRPCDAVAKTKMWHDDFGNQIVAAAVLSGVYDLANLELAQASGIFLFWAHDLAKLTGWIKTTRP